MGIVGLVFSLGISGLEGEEVGEMLLLRTVVLHPVGWGHGGRRSGRDLLWWSDRRDEMVVNNHTEV